MRSVSDWQIQTAWWVSSIFATGAAWYFLSTSNATFAAISAVLAALLAGVAIYLHRKKDALAEARAPESHDRSTGRLHANEAENAVDAQFKRLSKQMPELLSEFRKDLREQVL